MPIAEDTEDLSVPTPDALAPQTPSLRDAEFLVPGTRVERYELVERLGAGGMGVVYKAYDSQLSRHVALKFLRHDSTDLDWLARAEEYRERLLREAQALAKLSHPNVVTVFEVGEHRGAVFLAMEFIEGVSLRAWVSERKGRTREVLRALIDAGRGLAAAHRAGVLHRDFKLGNVMVSEDGRVRVFDFGLARAASPATPLQPEEASGPVRRRSVALSGDLTQSGALLGTVGYIAPESFQDGTLDARSDQFSYAESVFVALTGRHSHDVESPEAYRAALLSRRRLRWPRGSSHRVRRVVERGLASNPAERYPNLDAMVDALERATRPARAWVVAGVALPVAALGLLSWKLWPASCAVSPDAFAGVWDSNARAEVERAFVGSGKPHAADTFQRVAAQLDFWLGLWERAKVEACRATRVRREQPERVWSVQSACLDAKRAQLDVLVSLLRRADPALIDRAVQASHEVAPLEECANVPLLLGESDALPADPARRDAIEKLGSELDTIETLVRAGRWNESFERVQRAAAQADELAFAPARARAHSQLSNLLNRVGRRDESVAANERALRLAAEARSDELIAVLSIRRLFQAVEDRKLVEARAMLPLVAANVERSGDPNLHIQLLVNEAGVLVSQRRYDEAHASLDRAQAECTARGDAVPWQCFNVGQMRASVYLFERNPTAALRELRQVVEAKQRYLGPHHPLVALEHTNVAGTAAMAGDAEGARVSAAAARAAGAASQQTEVRLDVVDAYLRELAEGCTGTVEAFGAIQSAVDDVLGADSGEAALVRLKIGECRSRQGQHREAMPALEQAVAIRRAAGSPDLAEALFVLAQTQSALGDGQRAEASAREALALWREEGPLWAAEAASVEAWLQARR